MRIPRRLPQLCALLALALPVAGCGGGGGDESTAAPGETTEETTALTKEELIAQGDGICAEVNAAVGTVGSTSAEARGQASQGAGLYGGLVERLKDPAPPSDDSAGYAEVLAAAEELAQAEDNVKLASEREEPEAVSEAEAEASSALDSFQSAASAFGFEDCAEAPAAPVPGGSVGEAGGEEEAAPEEELEEVAPEEELEEAAPEEGGGVEEGGGAGVGGGTEGGGGSVGGGESGVVGPG